MKRFFALGLVLVMSFALLAGCSSADPENPYGQEPAPKVEASHAVVETLL